MLATLGRPLLVGEADPPSGVAMRGRSGRFLAALLGMGLAELLAAFECRNLLRADGRREGKGRRFGEAERMAGWLAARGMGLRGRAIVLCGRRVGGCFGLRGGEGFCGRVALGRGEAAAWLVPHPSGIVRWWNDTGNRHKAACALLDALLLAGRAEPPA